MKNGCNEILEAKVAERTERAKKLYRYVSDVARRIGEMTSASQSIHDLFSTHLEVQRQKLRDNCEKLVFLDPINYGKKSLELLWRKVYYDTVTTAKKFKESENENDSYLFTHIVCGIGHFHHFISRLETEMKVQCKELDYTLLHKDEEFHEMLDVPTDEEMQFSRSALHSCLIYLGDLCRYQVEIFHDFDPSIAARYYFQAAHVDMTLGMPYNQLGNLYLDKNYNLDSVCYYIQCLSCTTPFEGSIGNLTKIFEKNGQCFDSSNHPETMSQAEHIQNTITDFLSLIEIWYMGKSDTNIPQRCGTIAQELKVAMDFVKTPLPDIEKKFNEYTQALEEEDSNPSFLNGNLVHKIVLICLFTITKITETDEVKAFACKAFTLALLSQLLQKLLKQLEELGLKNPASKYKPKHTMHQYCVSDTPMVQEVRDTEQPVLEPVKGVDNEQKHDDDIKIITKENLSEENIEIVQNGDAKTTKKGLTKRRTRRRRLASSGSSDMSDNNSDTSDTDTFESCSDEEDISDSSSQSDDIPPSDDSCYEVSDSEAITEVNNVVDPLKGDVKHIAQQNLSNGDLNTKKEVDEDRLNSNPNKQKELNVQGLQDFLLGDNFLPSIKLLQDWALNEKDLILSCGDSGESLFQCVVDLLNILTFYFNPKSNEAKECHILEYTRRVAKKLKLEYKTIPLPEDINLRGTNICKFDKDAAEWQILDRYQLSLYDENIIRILNFVDFGNHIAKIIPRIKYNRSLKVFYLKKTAPPKVNTKINHKRSREWHNSKKTHVESNEGGLLRRLGRLWLVSQVRELERSGGQAPVPALLALDTASLHKHLRRVKQLLRARSFILLIPSVVLQELDNLKREESSARDAIRWLEVQLRSGSRFLRAQRPGQSRPLPLLKYPRKAPPHIHNFIQILEFCNHLIAEDKQIQGGNGDPDNSLQGKSAPLLILLVGNERVSDEEQYKEFSVTGAAHAAGISVEFFGDFYTKWRQTIHKNGKKR